MERVARGRGARGRGARGRGGRAGRRAGRGHDGLVVGLLTQLLARFPPLAPQGPVVEVQQRVAEVEQPRAAFGGIPPYLDMMGQMQRIGTMFFEGGVGPEETHAWHPRLEWNFRSIRCPLEYQVELAVHHLNGDAHL
ncbi:unnamed protein product [Microthlaspi erraticum]|uniref:Uncharacterized protein n=1 Tax=Microthlaspi erraticum TaxID=1685480 RepID=A0A6D2I3E9_9BRAS|nr:unnamed protein product [Microthlaspi erraticum]